MRSSDYQEKLVIGTAHESMRMQFSLDPYPRGPERGQGPELDYALHCIALHCIALHCIALHCIALHCIALYCIALHCIAFYHGVSISGSSVSNSNRKYNFKT
jgi:hypothetical protein